MFAVSGWVKGATLDLHLSRISFGTKSGNPFSPYTWLSTFTWWSVTDDGISARVLCQSMCPLWCEIGVAFFELLWSTRKCLQVCTIHSKLPKVPFSLKVVRNCICHFSCLFHYKKGMGGNFCSLIWQIEASVSGTLCDWYIDHTPTWLQRCCNMMQSLPDLKAYRVKLAVAWRGRSLHKHSLWSLEKLGKGYSCIFRILMMCLIYNFWQRFKVVKTLAYSAPASAVSNFGVNVTDRFATSGPF